MAATKLSGLVITELYTLASALTGVTTKRGRHRYQENDDPEATLRGQTAETKAIVQWFIEERTAPAPSATTSGSLTIHGQVSMRLRTQESSEMDVAYDLMDSIFEAVMQETDYNILGVRPVNGRWGRDVGELENDIAVFFISITFQTGPICETQ